MSDYTEMYLKEVIDITNLIDKDQIDKMVSILSDISLVGGRIFFIGVGGGAGNATHAVNDFRKIANIESYTPTDNVSELTARINDDGWDSSYEKWLKVSRINNKDLLFIFSLVVFAGTSSLVLCAVAGSLSPNITARYRRTRHFSRQSKFLAMPHL